MEQRVNIQQTVPDVWKAMYSLSGTVLKSSSLTPLQKHLIDVRASQLNSCAFCLNMHTQEALQSGETAQRLFVLSAWREAKNLFTDEEQAILAITEEVTLIHQSGLSEATYQQAARLFSAEAIAQIIMAVVAINAWNRIAVATHLPVSRQ